MEVPVVTSGWESGVPPNFRSLFLVSAGNVYVGRRGLDEYLSWIRDQEQVVLGFEGFQTDGYWIIPLIDFIADLSSIDGSWEERVAKSGDAAKKIVDLWGPAVQFVSVNGITEDE